MQNFKKVILTTVMSIMFFSAIGVHAQSRPLGGGGVIDTDFIILGVAETESRPLGGGGVIDTDFIILGVAETKGRPADGNGGGGDIVVFDIDG